MDINQTLQSLNAYARDYLLYLFGLFDLRADRVAEDIRDDNSPIIVHALISLTLGSFIQQIIITGVVQSDQVFLKLFGWEIAFWIFMAIVLSLVTRIIARTADFATVFSIVLRVFPPSFALSAFASALIYASTFAFSTVRNTPNLSGAEQLHNQWIVTCNAWTATLANALVEWGLVAVLLYPALSQASRSFPGLVASDARSRTLCIVSLVLLVTIIIHLTIFFAGGLDQIFHNCFVDAGWKWGSGRNGLPHA